MFQLASYVAFETKRAMLPISGTHFTGSVLADINGFVV
jgi:hypothetical protein